MSQVDLAAALAASGDPRLAETDYKRISAWENGSPRVSFYAVEAIARATGQPLEFFAEGPTPLPSRPEVRGEDLEELRREVELIERRAAELAARLRRRQEEDAC